MGDEIRLMQDGVREWVQRAARRGSTELRARPTALLSLLCASTFGPLLMAGGIAGAGIAVLSSVGSGVLGNVVSDALNRLRERGQGQPPSRDQLEKGIAQQIHQVLAGGDRYADALRGEIALVLKGIDAGGTALRAAMEQASEQVRTDVIAVLGALGSDFTEMGFLLKDVAQAAVEIQRSLDAQGADVRAIIEQNTRQSADIRLVREDLAAIAWRSETGAPVGAGQAARNARWGRGCPYRGLLPFDESDADVFYGRERLSAELAVKLAARAASGGLLVVTGASGAGKSSLLQAGLLPLLARGQQVQGSGQWHRVVMTPTKDPLTELAARLAAIGGSDAVAVRDGLARQPGQGHLVVWSAALAVTARHRQREASPALAGPTARLVLIVDQFEQVFTLNPGPGGEADRRAFITALRAAATNPVGPMYQAPAIVVISVRGDFWDRCAAYPELKDALQDGPFIVGPMTESEFRVTITGPAEAAGHYIDPALTDTILSDLRAAGGENTSGVLPLLSQAMSLTWEKREGNQLTSHGYAQAGGVSHAVQTGAEKAYNALSAGQQALARNVFRAMTAASREGRLARRPVTRDDLYAGLPTAARSDIGAVLDAFATERLVVLDGSTAQIAHDVLLQAWPRLHGWLEEDQASWILHGQLADAANAWEDTRRDPSFLYRGTPLTALQHAMTGWSENPRRYPALTSTQRDFVNASERAVTRGRRRRRFAVAVLALLFLLASVASGVAFHESNTAVQEKNTAVRELNQAIYNQVASEALQFATSDTPLAAQLHMAAYRLQPTQDQASRLFDTENEPLSFPLAGPSSTVITVAFSADGRTLAVGSDGTVRLWNIADPAHPQPLGQSLTSGGGSGVDVSAVAFSPKGHTLITGNSNGTVRLWNTIDPANPQPIGQPLTSDSSGSTVSALAFSPDGLTLVTGNFDGTARLWNIDHPARPQPLGQPLNSSDSGAVSALAFSTDGHTLAIGSNAGAIRLWNTTDPANPQPLGQPLTRHGSSVNAVTFDHDGHTLAAGNAAGAIRLWNTTDPANPQPLGQPLTGNGSGVTVSVNALAFSPDGLTLAAGHSDGTVGLWNTTDPANPQPLGQPLTTGSSSPVNAVAFSPDGRTLAAGYSDGTVRLWSLPLTSVTSVGGSPVNVAAFSPDGRTLAAGNGDGTVRLWNTTDPAHPTPLGHTPATGSPVNAVAFSPDDRTLAAGYSDGTVRLWNIAHPAHPTPLGSPLTTGSPVNAVAFSPDGHTLASDNVDGTVRLWNIADPANPKPLGAPLATGGGFAVDAVAFSPDGRTLASGNGDGTVRLWSIADPAHPTPLGHTPAGSSDINAVAFSPDGRTLASGNSDGTVRLWNIADLAHPKPLGRPLTGSSTSDVPVAAVGFSHDGRTLASGNSDGTVGLWNTADPAHPKPLGQPLITGSSSRVATVAFNPNGSTLATGSGDGFIRFWNLNPDDAMQRICSAAGGLTPLQWHDYIPQLPYRLLCSS